MSPHSQNEDDFFRRERPRLLALAYRSLGSTSDADDVVQEAWLRWQRSDQLIIDQPSAWLTTVTAHLAIDRLRVRQRERQRYVGPWLPDPIRGSGLLACEIASPVDIEADHVRSEALAESVTIGLLAVLERLDPVERVVLLLADVFGESFTDIAGVVEKTPAACRKIASRARQRVRDERRERHASDRKTQIEVATAFSVAAATGDVRALIALLSTDALLLSDGGENRHAARRPIVTPDRIARFVINVFKKMPQDASLEGGIVNGEQAFLWSRSTSLGTVTDGVLVVEVRGGLISGIFIQINPDKLAHLTSPDD
jgi:RNA polymerase sigma-70 factor, ECF subfamily